MNYLLGTWDSISIFATSFFKCLAHLNMHLAGKTWDRIGVRFTFCLQTHLRVTFACSQTSQRKKTFSVEELDLLCHWLMILLQHPARCNLTCQSLQVHNESWKHAIEETGSLNPAFDSYHDFFDGQDDELNWPRMLLRLSFFLAEKRVTDL